jgi:[protein-PII] uridylyltransferase
MLPASELEKMFDALTGDRDATVRAEALNGIDDAAALAGYLKKERGKLLDRILSVGGTENGTGPAPVGGLQMAREFSDLTDAVIQRMFALACRRAGANPGAVSMAIVATGGYGRRELAAFSDIDMTFIPQRDGDQTTDRIIREMFTLVMDVCIARCGLEVGYAYRLLEDCSQLDHQTMCGLLDARLIAGNNRLFIQFEDAYWTGFNPTDFIFSKLQEREKLLGKWGRTVRVVEPQLKEGPGGLRDLQTAVWLTQARWQLAAARVRGPRSLDALIREADVPPSNAALLALAKERLFQVRNALHALAGSERDQLVVTRQEELARLLGYRDERFVGADRHGAPPVERFMADLYPSLALVRRISDQVMRRVGNSRLILGIGLDCKHRQIVPANNSLESDDPAWMLWMCELAQQYDIDYGEDIERAAVLLVEMNPIIADQAPTAQVFLNILSRPLNLYKTLQKMADLGILGWFLPEFGSIIDLIPYDPSHDHTVGQHTLIIVKHLEALLTSSTEEDAEMKRIFGELPHPERLMLAVLLHDCGKAVPGRPHSETGEDIASAVCKRIGLSDEATATVCFLVANHLVMAETSRLRDLNLDETLREFTEIVGDQDRLNMLYLLTYADTRAVGEGVWTQVKARFLRELWQRASAVLSDEEPVGYDAAAIARARRRLLKDLSLENLPVEDVAEHIQAMPAHYLLNQPLKQIGLHIGFVRGVRKGQPVVDFHGERDATYTELTVCAFDDPKPGLLAKIAGVLAAADVNVHGAQVVTRTTERDRIALDTLLVDFRGRQISPGKRREVAANLTSVLTGVESVETLLAKRRTSSVRASAETVPKQIVYPRVSVRRDVSENLTLIEISAPDTIGAFYRFCDAISRLGWDIHSARVSTWTNEARAGFYVTGCCGLSDDEVCRMLHDATSGTFAG